MGNNAACVKAEVDEQLLQFVDIAHPEKRCHVALEDALHHIFPQKPLAESRVLQGRRLGKSSHKQVVPEEGKEVSKPCSQLGSVPWG